jgi:hypothetical protein
MPRSTRVTSPRHLALRAAGFAAPLGRPAAVGLAAAAAYATLLAAATAGAHGAPAGTQRTDPPAAPAAPAAVAWRSGTVRSGALAARLTAVWGGPTLASNGETVDLEISDSYPEDPAFARRWADEVAALLHGSELARVRVVLAPLDEVQLACGEQALACYSAQAQTLVTTPDDIPGGPTAQALLAHEYGHHVAANRVNPPWRAIDWGTKRWATVTGVCLRASQGMLFPGDEGRNYELNPGEGFAEAYRVLNERRLGRPEFPWGIVSPALYPGAPALAALEQDVAQPWTGPTRRTISGRFVRGGARARKLSFATPLDGSAVATLRAPRGARFTVELLSRSGAVMQRAASTGGAAAVRTTLCGSRSLALRLRAQRGAGRYSLTVSRP